MWLNQTWTGTTDGNLGELCDSTGDSQTKNHWNNPSIDRVNRKENKLTNSQVHCYDSPKKIEW